MINPIWQHKTPQLPENLGERFCSRARQIGEESVHPFHIDLVVRPPVENIVPGTGPHADPMIQLHNWNRQSESHSTQTYCSAEKSGLTIGFLTTWLKILGQAIHAILLFIMYKPQQNHFKLSNCLLGHPIPSPWPCSVRRAYGGVPSSAECQSCPSKRATPVELSSQSPSDSTPFFKDCITGGCIVYMSMTHNHENMGSKVVSIVIWYTSNIV